MRALTICFSALVLAALGGCGDDARRPGDTSLNDSATGDTGRPDTTSPPADSRPTDTGTMDTGPMDACETDDATSTVECNGPIIGSGQADDALFGLCVPDDTDQGSCTDATAVCYAFAPDGTPTPRGVCVPACTPNGRTYVNSSTCPSGTRCFDFGSGVGFCFADCNVMADCPSGQCDGDNSCVGGDSSPVDGGTDGAADGGMDAATDGGTDGAVDGGTDAATDSATDAAEGG